MQDTQTLLTTVTDLETANSLRSFLGKKSSALWLYVMRDLATSQYNVLVSNEWGGSLSPSVVELLKNECGVFLSSMGKESVEPIVIKDKKKLS